MKQKNNLAIKLVGVTKVYKLHHEKPTFVENIFRRNKSENFVALDSINLEIKRGEKVGIIGSNGSGKTTLLKIISGIATANSGFTRTWGRLISLIDLSAGFHPELTGIENVFQNAMLLGMSKSETKLKLPEIIEFADIGGFIDSPMFTYSEGMKLRLGFSVAMAADPDILILDEGISVGDENFQKKSLNKINEIVKHGKTILVTSHWMEYLRLNCQRVLWLENGVIKMQGGIDILNLYEGCVK